MRNCKWFATIVILFGAATTLLAEDTMQTNVPSQPPKSGLEQTSKPIQEFCGQLQQALLSNKIDGYCQFNEIVPEKTAEILLYLSGADLTPDRAANIAFGTLVNVASRFPVIAGYQLQRLRLQAANTDIKWMLTMDDLKACEKKHPGSTESLLCIIKARKEF